MKKSISASDEMVTLAPADLPAEDCTWGDEDAHDNDEKEEEKNMERKISRTVEVKKGRTWEITYTTDNAADVYENLAHDLHAKYICKAAYIRRITDRSNYDGTRTVTVTYDNDCRSVYIVRN